MHYQHTSRSRAAASGLVAVVACALCLTQGANGQGAGTVIILPDDRPHPSELALGGDVLASVEFSRTHMMLGLEYGSYVFRNEDLGDWMSAPAYIGVRYARDLGLNWAYSLMAGYLTATNLAEGADDLQFVPVRAQLEVGTHLGNSLSRWYVGGGGGYNFTDDVPSDGNMAVWPLPAIWLDAEWLAHVVVGFDFHNESRFSLRVEVGYLYFSESEADMLIPSFTLAYQF